MKGWKFALLVVAGVGVPILLVTVLARVTKPSGEKIGEIDLLAPSSRARIKLPPGAKLGFSLDEVHGETGPDLSDQLRASRLVITVSGPGAPDAVAICGGFDGTSQESSKSSEHPRWKRGVALACACAWPSGGDATVRAVATWPRTFTPDRAVLAVRLLDAQDTPTGH